MMKRVGSTMTPEPECQIPGCNRTEKNHSDRVHSFQANGETLTSQPPPKSSKRSKPSVVAIPDASLRLLMIRKGLISPEELNEVDLQMSASGVSTLSERDASN